MRKLVLTFFVSLFGGFLALSVHNLYYDHSNNNISDEKDNMVNISFNPSSSNNYCAGYFNTTSAIDAIQFKFESGNIDSGTITLYGIS